MIPDTIMSKSLLLVVLLSGASVLRLGTALIGLQLGMSIDLFIIYFLLFISLFLIFYK